jgi:hypothetical protein
MAFDMYAGEKHEMIDHHEEFIFSLIKKQSDYPELDSIWSAFYDDPHLSVNQADLLTHELIALLANNGGSNNKQLCTVVNRLVEFFSFAYANKIQIKCLSD